MEKPRRTVSVVMQRRAVQNRWLSAIWEPWAVIADAPAEAAPRMIVGRTDIRQWLHPGFALVLHRDEAEGYYLNVSSDAPRVFVLWRMEGEDEGADEARAVPLEVTVSSDEAGRWLDGGHSVDGVPMPPEIFAWVGQFVEENYRPQPKKRIKPRSFVHPKDRVR
jgi:hypothetical protein